MRVTIVLGLLVGLLAAPPGLSAQSVAPVTRVFSGSVAQVWDATFAALKSLGWRVDQADKPNGSIVTDSRALDFKEFGVYGEGTRHKLRLVVKGAGEGRTAVSVEREVYREERILWMPNRKTLQATDQNAENAVLDGIERTVPAVAAVPAPAPTPPAPPAPSAPPAAAAPSAAPAAPAVPPSPPPAAPAPAVTARPSPSRGEFTYKVTYRVKGTAGSVVLIYRNSSGGTEQTSARLPWELSFDAKGGTFLYVSAQNQGVSGSVICEILLDNESRTTSTSSGAYVIAECSNAAERN